jgi:hypothetical protein
MIDEYKYKLTKMLNDVDYLQFLQDITKCEWFSYPAHEIAKIVANGNYGRLSPKQRRVYKWYVYRPIENLRHCRVCGVFIAWKDMYYTLATDNLCYKCAKIHF